MSYFYSSGTSGSGSGYRDHYYGFNAEFTGFMIITFGTFISLFLIVIMILVWCICCRVKKPSNRVFVHPMDQLHRGPVAYVTNHDQVQYLPSPNVQRVQRQQTLLTGQLFDSSAPLPDTIDQVQYMPSPNVQRVQRQQTLLTGQPLDSSALPPDTTGQLS